MFGIGMPELILILALALIVIGPKKLPDLAKSLGRAMNEFKKATSDIKDSMGLDEDIQTVKNTIGDFNDNIKKAIDVTDDSPLSETADETQKDDLAEKNDKLEKKAAPEKAAADNEEEGEYEVLIKPKGKETDERG